MITTVFSGLLGVILTLSLVYSSKLVSWLLGVSTVASVRYMAITNRYGSVLREFIH